MVFNVGETLKAGDLPADVLPHLLWSEMILGTRKRLIFLEPVTKTDMLIGAISTKITVPVLSTRFSAGTITESNLDSSGYNVTDPAITDTDINIGNQVYVAFRISDILKEDSPNINWIRTLLRDSGRAIAEYEDAAVRDIFLAGAGNVMSSVAAGTLAYDDVIDMGAMMKTDSWFPEDIRPILFVHPEQEANLLKDTRYVNSHRYMIGDIPDMPAADDMSRGEVEGMYAGTRVRVTDNMTSTLALVVFPEHPRYGPVSIHAYKRPLTIRTQREELYGRQLWVLSTRYGTSVIQADAVGLISNC
jgi:hypothetical protein